MNAFELDHAGQIETKRLLRAGYAGLVDPEILNRRKVSFPVPFMELLSGPLSGRLSQTLKAAPRLSELLSGSHELQGALDQSASKKPLLSWLLMNLALTEQRWRVGE
jgi:hypothetical protein